MKSIYISHIRESERDVGRYIEREREREREREIERERKRKRGLLTDDLVNIQVYCDAQLDAHKKSH